MSKKTKYPRLRTHVRRGTSGQVWVYYYFDMRAEGKPDIPLGRDHAQALKKWDELYNQKPRTIGRLAEAFNRFEERVLPEYESQVTRADYTKYLRKLRPVFDQTTWEEITLPVLREYLDRRKAKTQGNREMSLLSVIWGKARIWGMTSLPWPAAGVKGWKNQEQAREFEVTDELFAAVYAEGDQVLRDCMDIATATGMRLTDARTVRMPVDGMISFASSKKGKRAQFAVAESAVLSAIASRREAMDSYCVMLLSTPTGRAVTAGMLRSRWDDARDKAALKAQEAGDADKAQQIRAMYLRDMRKRAADLAGDLDEASRLLQHSSKKTTATHYRTKAVNLKAVR